MFDAITGYDCYDSGFVLWYNKTLHVDPNYVAVPVTLKIIVCCINITPNIKVIAF